MPRYKAFLFDKDHVLVRVLRFRSCGNAHAAHAARRFLRSRCQAGVWQDSVLPSSLVWPIDPGLDRVCAIDLRRIADLDQSSDHPLYSVDLMDFGSVVRALRRH